MRSDSLGTMRRSISPHRLLGGLVLLGALLAGCSGGDDTVEVRMLDNTYAPNVVRIEPGTDVRFVGAGRAPHNAVAFDESWSTETTFGDIAMNQGDSTVVTFDTPGRYDFFCTFHATRSGDGYEGMVGTIIVGDVADPTEVIDSTNEAPAEWSGRTVRVPADYATIQSGVDAAEPGDLVLVGPGVYREAVTVTTPGLTIRGEDRNAVILDGELTRENGLFITADGVAVENMTARSYTTNGFFWSGVVGYRGSYLTAYDNDVYGIYAFDAVDGLFEHSYASGSWDAGFYIGQCDPCNAIIRDSVAEYNALGYSGTNSSREIYIVDNVFRHNISGIVPNTLDSELLPPVNNVYVGGNLIHDSGASEQLAPYRLAEWPSYGNGVVLAGSVDSVVEKNLIINSPSSGVMVVSNIDANLWPSRGNIVRDNTILGSGRADVSIGGPLQMGSCLSGENGTRTVPGLLAFTNSCDGLNLPMPLGLATASEPLGRIIEYNFGRTSPLSHGDAPDPDLTFDQIPGGVDAPVVPAVAVFAGEAFDVASVTTPEIPTGMTIADPAPVFLGVNLAAGFWPVVMGVLLWWIPMAVWVLGGLWALARIWGGRAEVSRSGAGRLIWTLLVAVLPAVGVLLFAMFGNTRRTLGSRLGTSLLWLVLWLGVTVGVLLVGSVFGSFGVRNWGAMGRTVAGILLGGGVF